jgi:TolB-like protein/cytochrome c-type biogenesis protein CcmH/NrfG
LPLENLSGDSSQEYFSDGTTEALISSLAQIRALKVISRTSAMRYKRTTKPLPEIARELGVDAIVEGTVQRSGTRVRISAHLIRAATDESLWARDYDEDASDALKLEANVAQDIAQGIRVEVTSQESQRLRADRHISAAAQDAYFQGRYHGWKLDEEDLKEAIGYYEQAVRIEPDFAEAYAGLSHAWHERGVWGAISFRDSEAPVKSAARRALDLDPNLADAHTALGDALYMYDLNWTGADEELRRGVDLDPNNLEAHTYYGNFLMAAGRFPEAIREAERAVSIDPVSSTVQSNYARILFRARKYQDAEIHYKKAIELDSQDFAAYTRLAEVFEQTGRLEEALKVV